MQDYSEPRCPRCNHIDCVCHVAREEAASPTPCFIIRHMAWNSARVFVGPDGEKEALAYITQFMNDTAEGEPPITFEAVSQLAEDGELDDWELFEDGLIHPPVCL